MSSRDHSNEIYAMFNETGGNVTQGTRKTTDSHFNEFIVFQATAFCAFTGNLLVCTLFYRKKTLLKKTYNILFFCLAILGVLISVTIATTYVIVLSDVKKLSLGNVQLGSFLCRVLWSRWLLHFLFAISVNISVLLNIERWYIVTKPLIYNSVSSKKKVIISLFLATTFALIFTCSFPFEVIYTPFPKHLVCCSWKRPGKFDRLWGIIQFTGLLLIPCIVKMGLFQHSAHKTKLNVVPIVTNSNHHHNNKNNNTRIISNPHVTVTKLIAADSVLTLMFWTPNQVYFLLAKFGILKLDTPTHHYLEVWTLIVSCINPVIYGVTSKTFHKGYWEALLSLFPAKVRKMFVQSRGELEQTIGSVIFLVHTMHHRRSQDWRFKRRAAIVDSVENDTITTIN